MRACRAFVLAACAGVAAACTNFADPTTVVDLRILGVRAEPSEIILDANLSDPSMPTVANNPPLVVTPLIADPAGGGRPVSYTISACPNNPFAPAPPGGGQGGGAFPSGGARTTVGSALCDENSPNTWLLTPAPVTVDLTNPMGTPVTLQPTVDMLAAAFMTDVFPDQYGNLHGGFDLGMPLTLDIKVDAGTVDSGIDEIRGVKRVLYWAEPIDLAQMPNQTPMIDTVSFYPARDETTFQPIGDKQTIPADAPFDVGGRLGSMWIEPSAATAESFETTVIDADTHKAVPFTVPRETLRYRFFATAGTFAPPVSSSEPLPGFVATGPIHLESEYRPPSASQIATDADGHAVVTIWIVVRDDRGGESWVTRQLLITP
jgi:hypothetical protein